MTLTEAGEGTVIGRRVGRQDSIGHALPTPLLQLATRSFPVAVAIQKNRQHELGMVPLLPLAVFPVRGMKRREVHVLDRVEQKPDEVFLRKPLPYAGRQEEQLVPITVRVVVGQATSFHCIRSGHIRGAARIPKSRPPLNTSNRGFVQQAQIAEN